MYIVKNRSFRLIETKKERWIEKVGDAFSTDGVSIFTNGHGNWYHISHGVKEI